MTPNENPVNYQECLVAHRKRFQEHQQKFGKAKQLLDQYKFDEFEQHVATFTKDDCFYLAETLWPNEMNVEHHESITGRHAEIISYGKDEEPTLHVSLPTEIYWRLKFQPLRQAINKGDFEEYENILNELNERELNKWIAENET